MKKRKLLALFTLLLAVGGLMCGFEAPQTPEELAKALHGKWRGSFYVVVGQGLYTPDNATFNFINGSEPKVNLSVETSELSFVKVKSWELTEDGITFTYNDAPWTATLTLSFADEKTLTGLYQQYGKRYETTMTKVSSTPIDLGGTAQYFSNELTGEAWLAKLKEYGTYPKGSQSPIPFTYELGQRERISSLIAATNVDAKMAAAISDVEQMQILLDGVCTTFRHNGESGMPTQLDALSVANYARANNGVECRGLSILLAELCRAYGIPAKPIKCAPYQPDTEFCHVVVHAWSESRGQWIMLDPTYRLMLSDEQGNYVNLPMLRESLINGTKLVANADAGHNGRPFYMDYYRAYMAENCFHFSSVADATFGAGPDGSRTNQVYTLIPKDYPNTYARYRYETATYSPEDFWAAPKLSKQKEEANAQ